MLRKDGNPHHEIGVRWWNQSASTYSEAFLGPETARTDIPDDKIVGVHLIEYLQSPVIEEHQYLNSLGKELLNAADRLHSNIDIAEYNQVKLGFIVLKYVSDTLAERFEVLLTSFKSSKNECFLNDEA